MRTGCFSFLVASIIGLMMFLQLTSSAVAPVAGPRPVDTATMERGIVVYRSNYCGTCHALEAGLTTGRFAPSHDDAWAAAEHALADPGYAGSATTPAEYLRESVLNPSVYAARGYESTIHPMPPFTYLDEIDFDALIYMLAQQGRSG